MDDLAGWWTTGGFPAGAAVVLLLNFAWAAWRAWLKAKYRTCSVCHGHARVRGDTLKQADEQLAEFGKMLTPEAANVVRKCRNVLRSLPPPPLVDSEPPPTLR